MGPQRARGDDPCPRYTQGNVKGTLHCPENEYTNRMNTTNIVIAIALLVIIGGGVYYTVMTPMSEQMMEKGDDMIKEGEQMMEEGDDMKGEGEMMKKEGEMMISTGSYETYAPEKLAQANEGDVVLFFRASWCPTCRTLDADIKAHLKDIPAGVTILDVNYDNSLDLKKKYGVTYQHTLVQVDAQGNQITKWSGSPTLVALLSNVK